MASLQGETHQLNSLLDTHLCIQKWPKQADFWLFRVFLLCIPRGPHLTAIIIGEMDYAVIAAAFPAF